MVIVKALLLLAVVALGVIVAVFNPGETSFDYVVAQANVPTAWLIVGSFAVGAVLGAVIIGVGALRWRSRARRWQREAQVAQKEVVNLRSLPLNTP